MSEMKSSLSEVIIEPDDDSKFLYNDFTRITPNLWLGAVPMVKVNPEIKFIISLVGEYDKDSHYRLFHPHQQIFTTHFQDSETTFPSVGLLHGVADLINRLRDEGQVLVHCMAGINRSGMVTALALIKSGMKPAEAVELLRSLRDRDVLSNRSFYKWILEQ